MRRYLQECKEAGYAYSRFRLERFKGGLGLRDSLRLGTVCLGILFIGALCLRAFGLIWTISWMG